MNRLLFFLFLICSPTLVQAQFDVETSIKKKMLQNKYVEYLNGKGYEPEVDEDGDVKFRYNNRSYYITLDMQDTDFFRLALLSRLELTSEEDKDEVYRICHDLTKDVKVTKVYWLKNTLWVSSELLLADPDDYVGIFDRGLTLTEEAYQKFVRKWQDRKQTRALVFTPNYEKSLPWGDRLLQPKQT